MNKPMAVPHPVVLQGSRISLEPLAEEHFEGLLAIGKSSPEEFALTSTPVTEAEAEIYFATVMAQRSAGYAYPFTARLNSTGEIIGSSRYNALDFANRNTQLGWTWFRPDQYGTATNVESKLLMLEFAFSQLLFHRVSIRTDADNYRSRRAVLALGAKEEGILRRHMLKRDGTPRDTVVHSIIDVEWAETRQKITERLTRKLNEDNRSA